MPEGSNKHYPLTIDRVKEIKRLNEKGIKPESLEAIEIVSAKPKEIEPQWVDVVGQISLKSLDKAEHRKRNQQRNNNQQQQNKPTNDAHENAGKNRKHHPPSSYRGNNNQRNKN